jgi:uncharacterized protein (TIGR02001 family)
MKQVKLLAALGLMGLAGAANAGVSSTITATNDYDFRGVSQSATDPALQASLDYAHDSGWYIGAWASNIDFGPAFDGDIELDVYTGFTGKFNDDFSFDLGVVGYTYPGESDINTMELYGSLTYKWVKGKVSYSDDFYNTGETALYLDASVNVPLPANFSLQAHVGQSSGDAFVEDIIDYSAGVGLALGNFNLGLKYVATDASDSKGNLVTDEVFNNEDRVVFTIATTFPWK